MDELYNNIVKLKDLINELIDEKILPEDLKLKKVRKILRSPKGRYLDDISLRNIKGDRWAWLFESKDTVKIELSYLLK